MAHYTVQSPVLLLVFNRPDVARRVFDRVKAVRPSRLYIAADGPRPGVEKDGLLCKATREIYNQIDWDCSVRTRFNEVNKGCKVAVAEAITWFFEQEEEGIILEDDCLPSADFFPFCDQLLQRYRYDTRIMNITGTNLQMGRKWGEASYYFSQYSHIWGWASWRRAWQHYDMELSEYDEPSVNRLLGNIFTDPFLIEGWTDIFRRLKAGLIDSWDYQFNFTTFFQNGLCIAPQVNLISNLGFRPDATHTYNAPKDHAALPTGVIDNPLVHPSYFIPEKQADYFFLNRDFDLEGKWRTYHKNRVWRRRFKRWLRSYFRQPAS
ncbi:nucleotide-diphospho-sugar transferase [Chitinophaga flava]|uniref:Nucleotide-diphospho-sugar transferase n=1 Tax=Chitinophaga flava TaxID=2259036 RepID=A0A365Y5T6_9BACT|nr:nucleotide-diphospho-sugar transferase [Chitinophaga flava]RBL93860.1 nucleotide-diphospho-sugar transferase [Chitinophaga flava]